MKSEEYCSEGVSNFTYFSDDRKSVVQIDEIDDSFSYVSIKHKNKQILVSLHDMHTYFSVILNDQYASILNIKWPDGTQ